MPAGNCTLFFAAQIRDQEENKKTGGGMVLRSKFVCRALAYRLY